MNISPDHYRREAMLVEQVAERISLRTDKEELLAEARSLRRRAAELEARPDGATDIGQTPPWRGICD